MIDKDWPGKATAKARMMAHMNTVTRGVYVGELSVESGLTLRKTDILVEELVESGLLRWSTAEELHRMGVPEGAQALQLSVARELKLAYRP